MKPSTQNRNVPLFTLLLAATLLIACQWLSGAVATQADVNDGDEALASVTPVVELNLSVTEPPAPEPDPLDHLLAMRSVKINLTSLHADGTRRIIDLEIDNAGGMHLKYELPGPSAENLPEEFDPNFLTNSYKLYVLDGKVYRLDEQNPGWMTSPLNDDYLQRISRQFHGADSPALWLDILPEGSIQAAGNETVGGFAADKYTVSGTVDGQAISGTLWFEPQADALVQAELHIPAALISTPEHLQSGELLITLKTEKADVPPVTLPSPP